MGRSTASCFKIIRCGCDPIDKDYIDDSKGPRDKRGWSFRKRSTRDRVLIDTVASETESFLHKEIPETVNVDYKPQSDLTVSDKSSSLTWMEEKPNLSSSMKLQESAIENNKAVTAIVNLDESAAVSVQAAIRAFLAQNQLLKLRINVVKLQATIRGHLVRRHALGTLRCIQAITKIQALVRSHQAPHSVAKQSFGSMPKEEKGNMENFIEKLLSNKFACQLLESTPRTKQIYIKCDLSKSDSASKWFDRWMSVSSRGLEQLQKQESIDNNITIESEEENLITYDVNNFNFLECKPQSQVPLSFVKFSDSIQNQNEQKTDSSSPQQSVDCKNSTSCLRKMMINSYSPMNQYNGSECGTELSISSTLDSPEAPPTDVQPEKLSNVNSTNAKLKSEIGHSSVEASPSSQVSSISSKKDRRDKNMLSVLKHRSLSSGSKGSYEQLIKNGKRNSSSSGLGKTDTFDDQEPRDSSSSNSIPSYMQATESARAKALANSSPRSSPDVQDKDIATIKKRNGRYGSPHVQRSISQVQQSSKGNEHHTERKWQR
ncbi:protein IQ-DOMAIN 32-like [Impatiens glandulifera]|uniref:protein IQ-DOMAIN 32-like n=1 Tax=Impatiens glandulifera TaxID=253017 RepID=UPI001FB0B5E4|nr:protein IQ-DOMAIN 32-like [Impatiens glandulifera]